MRPEVKAYVNRTYMNWFWWSLLGGMGTALDFLAILGEELPLYFRVFLFAVGGTMIFFAYTAIRWFSTPTAVLGDTLPIRSDITAD